MNTPKNRNFINVKIISIIYALIVSKQKKFLNPICVSLFQNSCMNSFIIYSAIRWKILAAIVSLSSQMKTNL